MNKCCSEYPENVAKKNSEIQARDIKSLIEVSSALSDRDGHNGHRSLEINHFRQEKREAKGKKYSGQISKRGALVIYRDKPGLNFPS